MFGDTVSRLGNQRCCIVSPFLFHLVPEMLKLSLGGKKEGIRLLVKTSLRGASSFKIGNVLSPWD